MDKILTVDMTTTHQLFSDKLFCSNCKSKMPKATGENNVPVDGNIGICLMCGEIMVYRGAGNKMFLEKITDELLEEIKKEASETGLKIKILQHVIQSKNNGK